MERRVIRPVVEEVTSADVRRPCPVSGLQVVLQLRFPCREDFTLLSPFHFDEPLPLLNHPGDWWGSSRIILNPASLQNSILFYRWRFYWPRQSQDCVFFHYCPHRWKVNDLTSSVWASTRDAACVSIYRTTTGSKEKKKSLPAFPHQLPWTMSSAAHFCPQQSLHVRRGVMHYTEHIQQHYLIWEAPIQRWLFMTWAAPIWSFEQQ